MSLKDWIKSRVATMDLAARPWATRSRFNAFAYEFLLFGLKQAWACLYGGAMVALLHGLGYAFRQARKTGEKPDFVNLQIPAGPGFAIGLIACGILKFWTFRVPL